MDCPKGGLTGIGFLFDRHRSLQGGVFVSPDWTWRDALGCSYPHPFGFFPNLDMGNATQLLWWNSTHYDSYSFLPPWDPIWTINPPLWGEDNGIWALVGNNNLLPDASLMPWPWEEPLFLTQPTGAPGNVRVILTGTPRTYPQVYVIQPGGWETCYRSDGRFVTLSTAGLYTGNSATGVNGSVTESTADQVGLYDPAASPPQFRYYYFATDLSHWCEIGDSSRTDRGPLEIAPLETIFIYRQPGTPVLTLTFPAAL